jgi:hypothetical protein
MENFQSKSLLLWQSTRLKSRRLNAFEYIYYHRLVFPPRPTLCGIYPIPFFDNVTVAISEGHRQRIESDSSITSIIGCQEAFESFKNKFLFIKCFIFVYVRIVRTRTASRLWTKLWRNMIHNLYSEPNIFNVTITRSILRFVASGAVEI